jgi:ankyrin repeat protein
MDPVTGQTDFIRNTPLFVAVHCRNLPVVELLLRHNADVTLRDICGSTPLHDVADWNHFDEHDGGATGLAIAKLLLNHHHSTAVRERSPGGGTIEKTKNFHGHTALDNATESGHIAMVELLLPYK